MGHWSGERSQGAGVDGKVGDNELVSAVRRNLRDIAVDNGESDRIHVAVVVPTEQSLRTDVQGIL